MCNCSQKIRDMEININKLNYQIADLRQYLRVKEKKTEQFQSQVMGETLLLDLSLTDQSKLASSAIWENFTKMNSKVATLEANLSLLPPLRESIHKQTTIIYYLQRRVEALQKINLAVPSIERQDTRKKVQQAFPLGCKASPVRSKRKKTSILSVEFPQ